MRNSIKILQVKNTIPNRMMVEKLREQMRPQGIKLDLYGRGKRDCSFEQKSRLPLEFADSLVVYISKQSKAFGYPNYTQYTKDIIASHSQVGQKLSDL